MMIAECLIIVVVSLLTWSLLNHFRRHPKYPPGPYGLPFVGYMPFLGKEPHKDLGKLSKKYGNIFSITLGQWDCVVFNDYKSVRAACKEETLSARPPFGLNHLFSGAGQEDVMLFYGVAFNSGPVWQEQRRFVLKTLRDLGLGKQGMEDLITTEVMEVVKRMRENVGKPLVISKFFALAIVNALWTLITSERFQHDDPRLIALTDIVVDNFSGIDMVGPLYFTDWIYKMFPRLTGWKKIKNAVNDYREFFKREVFQKHKDAFKHGSSRDFTDCYLNEIHETTDVNSTFYGKNGENNLITIIMEMFLAGIESTSATIAWGSLYFTSFPDIQKKFQEEIDRVVGPNRLPNVLDRPRMPYVEATIMEILRFATHVPLSLHHAASADTEINGFFVPKGTVVFLNLHHAMNDPDYWGDPRTFRPERFLTEDGSALKKDEGFLAFLAGKRICPGESLARNQLFLFMTAMYQNFNIRLAETEKPSLDTNRPGMVIHPDHFHIILEDRYTKG